MLDGSLKGAYRASCGNIIYVLKDGKCIPKSAYENIQNKVQDDLIVLNIGQYYFKVKVRSLVDSIPQIIEAVNNDKPLSLKLSTDRGLYKIMADGEDSFIIYYSDQGIPCVKHCDKFKENVVESIFLQLSEYAEQNKNTVISAEELSEIRAVNDCLL